MKNLDCNQIKIFINLEIIKEEDKPLGTTIVSKPNFYHIEY